MGSQTILYGRIVLRGDLQQARQFLQTLQNDQRYPWLRTEMFSLGSDEVPYRYQSPVIAFAADYKALEYDLDAFVIKFEYILENIPFDTAKIEMETEFLGTYQFFWAAKRSFDRPNRFEPKDQMIETEKWFFGYGYRCMWGTLTKELEPEDVFSMDFSYPVVFDKAILTHFNALLDKIEAQALSGRIYLTDHFNYNLARSSKLHAILTYHEVRRELNYGYESDKGYWIECIAKTSRIKQE